MLLDHYLCLNIHLLSFIINCCKVYFMYEVERELAVL